MRLQRQSFLKGQTVLGPRCLSNFFGLRCVTFPVLARRRAVNRHLHYAFTRGAWPASRSVRYPVPFRQGGPFNFSRQVITHTRRSSRFGRQETASRLRERMRWSIAPTDEFVGVCIPWSIAPTDEFGGVWIPDKFVGVCGCLDSSPAGAPRRAVDQAETHRKRKGNILHGRLGTAETSSACPEGVFPTPMFPVIPEGSKQRYAGGLFP